LPLCPVRRVRPEASVKPIDGSKGHGADEQCLAGPACGTKLHPQFHPGNSHGQNDMSDRAAYDGSIDSYVNSFRRRAVGNW
jgi:hypothetical protein